MNDSPEQRGETLPPAENGGNPVLKKAEEVPHHLRPNMPVPGDNWTDDQACDLIKEIRHLVLMNAPRNMLLDDAEELAQAIWTSIRQGQIWK